MSKFWATFRLTYGKKIKAKTFIITTIIMILVILGAANMDKIVKLFDGGDDTKQVAIVTNNNALYDTIKAQGEAIDKDTKFEHLTKAKAEKALKNDSVDYIVEVTQNEQKQLQGTLVDTKQVSEGDKAKWQATLSQIQKSMIAQDLDLSPTELQQLQADSQVTDKVMNGTSKGTSHVSAMEDVVASVMVSIGNVLMFFIVINYANQVAMEVATEKTSRVSEMIITSVKPTVHVLSKVLSVIAVAFTQLVIFAIAGIASYYAFDLQETLGKIDFEWTPHLMRLLLFGIAFVVLSVIAYVILATILGNLTARIEDISQTLMPLTVLMLAGFYAGFFGTMNPEHTIVRVLSYVPFFSPFVTFTRLSLESTPTMEGLIAVGIHIVLVVVLVWVAAKTYKNAVLTFEKGLVASLKRAFQKEH
ncbi:sodium ABC transporter permease [Staphylococcus microti]|uniref:ABC-type Na+ efflux pump permease component n=1 Tax=Staphylococcus microti TaxID=569857 RepID=A0A0D6XRU9_9STAP|nr:ABC transporter permease [Staphylococcus microti]KIX91170.1 sodium ABC transporter permease [Staphylococcus microti]PNZ75756.1 ABC transporter permease [Staphylococcus microti]SUM58266.1 ABC-type Na+ efflux pump permease component [Staphylococcus microti]